VYTTYNEYEEEYLRNDKKDYAPWTVCPSWECRLDEDDPLGSICAMQRPHFAKSIVATFSLWTDDAFGRIWKNSVGKSMAYSQAWGYKSKHEDEASSSGVRLVSSDELLRNVLTTRDADLLVLVKLRRYEKGIGSRDSRFSHTIALVRIKKNLEFEFYKGAVNKLHQMRF
jgi:hypothetical protein